MANRTRGEVSFKAGDATYTLQFSINAICDLEEALDLPVEQIAEMFDGGSVRMRDVRTFIWAGLREHHPDIEEREAGRIATEVGVDAVIEKVGEAFRAAFPEVDAKPSGKKTKASRG